MIGAHFEVISSGHIQSLVDDSVREGKTIEYKLELPGNRDADKKEFLADVSSFANASGGDLLFGMLEARDEAGQPTGVPENAVGLVGINGDQAIRRLENLIRDGIEPRIPGIQIKAVEGFPRGPVIVARVPKSWAAPHMVAFKASPRFFTRTSAGKAPLDVAEIRAAFVQSAALPEKVRRFREERLGNILAGETPVRLVQHPLLVLHLLPVSAYAGLSDIDLFAYVDGRVHLPPMVGAGWSGHLNLDGYVTYSGGAATGERMGDYVQLFRNGAVEAVDAGLLTGSDPKNQFIPSGAFEEDILKGTHSYFKAYREIGIEGPVLVMVSLLHVRGFYMYTNSPSLRGAHRIEREHLVLPEVVVEDLSAPVDVSLRPALDLVWQACGYRCSLNYDDNGRWRLRH